MKKNIIENYEDVFQNSIDAQFIIDTDTGKIIKVNNAVVRIFGYKKEDIINKGFSELFPEQKLKSRKALLDNFNIHDGVLVQEFLNAKGEILHMEMILTIISWKENMAILTSMRDVSMRVEAEKELKKTYEKLETLSRIDPLTNLLNRRAMVEAIENEIIRFERSKEPFVLIICDIDDYKKINDTYGHDAGDFILVSIADLMRSSIRKQDVISRWGGDEFLLLLPQTDANGGKHLAENLREKIASTTFKFSGNDILLTMTFGISEFREELGFGKCMKQADNALYKGKKDGKNKVIVLN
ncbi:MAG: sensor domain-containing diguanylate cyclase [Candidatus Cloacimonetes bacterium]|nr:sensor domain-containing diguanylate cyclase [Candidatus Cloacimonadota bacterium]